MNIKHFTLACTLVLTPLPSVALNLAQDPLFLASTEPRIMLLLSRDHELYKKAYTDYSDLDPVPDGVLETTYKDTIEYYGYFDSRRCYAYTNNRFEPGNAATGANSHHCSGQWSGNFLNWATMTRMDIVRKVLYGGYRSTDNAGAAIGDTVLERVLLPSDVHAFAKVFAPAGGATEVAQYIPSTAHSSASITLCNVTRPPVLTGGSLGGGSISKNVNTSTYPPKLRIADGSHAQWAASEVIQCRVDTDTTGGLTATTRPTSAIDYNVRVVVCAPNKLESNCKSYPSGAVKPTGLLQKYGDIDAERPVRFGLMTGSYAYNKSGGVLRRNPSKITGNATASDNEINSSTGQFTNNPGIIDTINRLRISSFQFGDNLDTTTRRSNQYVELVGSGNGCHTAATGSFNDGRCPDWGNPLSEMYFEALRYFAGKTSPTTGFATTDSSYLASALPSATWSDPLPSTEWCALSNIIVLSTGLNTFDGDTFTDAPTGINVNTLTDQVGTAEGLAGATVLVGGNSGTHDKQCTAKTIGNLSDAKGICPEMPSTEGTYKIAGLAYANRTVDLRPGYATQRNNRWNSGTNPINPDWGARQPLGTYTVALAENLPEFSVTTQSGAKIKFLPACQAHTGWTPCTLTDIRVESTTATSGSFLAVWEDSQWGFDYDMDAISRISWCVGSTCTPGLAANQVKFTVSIPQKVSGASMRFGLIATGTTADGISTMLSGPGTNYNCTTSACTASTPASAPTPLDLTYTAGSSSAAITLQNPLWYAAKYGAPASSWDVKDNNTRLLVTGGDGIPDHFFEVRNPGTLGPALADVFDQASKPDGAASSVATNSNNLQTKTRIYRALFSSADWSGQLLQEQVAYNASTNVVSFNTEWDAGSVINSQNPTSGRVILTKGATDGVAFTSASLTTSQILELNTNSLGANDGLAASRVAYLRGDASNEGTTATAFRQRSTSKLGDIVHSNPWYVDGPSAGYSDVDHPGYSLFRTTYNSRTPMIYAGANDGMLHGFDASLNFPTGNLLGQLTADSGKEKLAYIPSAIYPNLSSLTFQNYNRNHRFFVDGSPMVADVNLNTNASPNWRTVLIGGMGGGGKGYYALDITDPAAFSEGGTAPQDILLWEFDEADMGFAFNYAPKLPNNQARQIVRICTSRSAGVCTTFKWAAILGNGYNHSYVSPRGVTVTGNPNGKAVLYVVFVADGIDGTWSTGDFVKIVADAPVAPATNSQNGLSTPVPFDSDGDGFADTVYAGDLKGNMWKFFIGPNAADGSVTESSSTWKVAFSSTSCGGTTTGCNPLFRARNSSNQVQPITWPAEVTLHPISGQMVLFGTGKYLESGDNSNTEVQSLYGIWDQHTSNPNSVPVSRGDLLQQTVSFQSISNGTTSRVFPIPSSNPINYATHKGWYMDLGSVVTGATSPNVNVNHSKERATGIPRLDNGVITFTSLIPSVAPCDAGGDGWTYDLNYYNGGLLNFVRYATNNSTVSGSTTIVGGYRIGATIGGTTFIPGTSGNTGVMVWQNLLASGGGGGGGAGGTGVSGGPNAQSRISWREILQ